MFNSIPVVAKAPILVLIMGNGMEPKITIAALVCFFPTLVNMVRGLRGGEPAGDGADARAVGEQDARSSSSCACYAALPYLFSALRIAASMSVIGAVVGEWIGATQGIGAMIIQATYNFDSAAAVRGDHHERRPVRPVLPGDRADSSAGSSAGSPKARTEPTQRRDRHFRQETNMNRSATGFRSRRAMCAWRPRPTWWWSAAVPPALSAAIAAARNGAEVILLERYNHLGGLASGGMVLVLDDMWDSHLQEISVRGICMTMIERMAARELATFPRQHEWGEIRAAYRAALGALGHLRLPQPEEAAPDLLRRGVRSGRAGSASRSRWWKQLGIELRLHSWFSRTLVEDGQVKGVICETQERP